ncbi:MAG: 5-bromo-4-chloroindolyl phosphate hydrolysis family protein [Pseudomonadota bacterium]
MTDRNPLERDAGALNPEPRRTGFQQAEAYGGPESYGPRAAPVDAPSEGSRVGLRTLLLSGAAMLGVTVLASLFAAPSWVAFLLGVLAFFIALAALRSSPAARRREIARVEGIDVEAVRQTLDEAEAELSEIDRLAFGLQDRGLRAPLAAMTAASRAVLEHIAADPDDLRRARKYVKVIIPTGRASVEKFAKMGVVDADLSMRFRDLVDDMREAADRQLETLKLDDKTSLEVEMEVLADRLRAGRGGPRPENAGSEPGA